MNPNLITNVLDIQDMDASEYNEVSVFTENLPVIRSSEEQSEEDQRRVDFDYVRSNQFEIIEASKKALDGALRLAISSENARSYEVVGNLLKTLSDINNQLLTAHESKEKLNKDSEESQQGSVVNNTQNNILFQGTTAELLQSLKDGF